MSVIINLIEWDVTYTELALWASDTGARVFAHASGKFKYEIDDQDFTAFKLAFKPSNGIIRYKSKITIDRSMYYCPYIPIINPRGIIKIDNSIT